MSVPGADTTNLDLDLDLDLDWLGLGQSPWHNSRGSLRQPTHVTRADPTAERGAIRKDPGGKLGVALAYPNAYRLGMANLGLHAVYRLFNDDPGTACERVFLPEAG
jgi:hypothetical protein